MKNLLRILLLVWISFLFPVEQVNADALNWEYRVYDSSEETNEIKFEKMPPNGLKLRREFKGFIEYKTSFKNSDDTSTNPRGIYLGQVGDVDKVFINGILIGQTGDFPPYYTNNMDIIREYLIPNNVLKNNESNEVLVITYVEYLTHKGLNINDVSIGSHKQLQQKKYAFDIFEYSTRIVIPLLCFFLAILSFPWIATNKIKGQAFLFCLAISGMVFGICRSRIPFHFFDILNVYKLTLISSISAVMFIFLYAKEICRKKLKLLHISCIVLPLSFILAITIQSDLTTTALIGKGWFYTEACLLLVFTSVVFFDSGYSRWHKLGFSTLFIFIMNDILRDLRIIPTTPLFHVGLGLFVSTVIIGQIFELKISWSNFIRRELELETEAKFGRTIAQIAHDLRSPLEVLKGLKEDLLLLPEDSRRRTLMCMNRIEEITYNLLKLHKQSTQTENKIQSEELLGLVESVLIEKGIEFRNRPHLVLAPCFDDNSYGLFSKIRRGSLKSILSNLLNNAADSFEDGAGRIEIKIQSEADYNVILIADNGPGIHENIKSMIFSKGFTTKTSGNGLGLFNAHEEIISVGGKVDFDTDIGRGTTFRISIPKSESPITFVKEINTQQYDKIIILDDDPGFHEVWIKKFKDVQNKLEHFYSVDDLLSRYESLDPSTLLISDFELMHDKLNGIDIILRLGNVQNSILSTARAEESDIQGRCFKYGIKLLPKMTVSFLKVVNLKLHHVLIDDDKLVHLMWKEHLSKNNLSFSSYFKVNDFIQNADKHDLETKIYIDSDLGEDIRGEIDSQRIFNLGFKNLYLSTGYRKDDIEKPEWILEIYPKSPSDIFIHHKGQPELTLHQYT